MVKRLKTVEQAMGLVIQHHVPPPSEWPEADAAMSEARRLEAHLDALPPVLAAALRAEVAKGTLVVTLLPQVRGVRLSSHKPKGRRPSAPAEG